MSIAPASVIIETPIGSYEWIEDWIKIPDSPLGRENGRTHAMVVSKDGEIILFHQANPAVLFYSPEGELLKSWGNYPGAHGMVIVEEDGVEYLWLADQDLRVVQKVTLSGRVVLELPHPTHPIYGEKKAYVPTWAAVNEKRFGGNGDVWVVDGYGASLCHRYSETGSYLGSIDGSAGAGLFHIPHGVWVDTRKGESELYVADRRNARVQVFDMEGRFKRVFGNDFLTSPDGFSTQGDILVVPELRARLTLCDKNDALICHIGVNDAAQHEPGWPQVDRKLIVPGKCNSPHGAVMAPNGDIYIAEWLVGGRVIKLRKR